MSPASVTFRLALLLSLLLVTACATTPTPTLTLGTTTSAYDSGILNQLLSPFERTYNIKVKVVAVGSGQALELGRRGDVDILLVHSPEDEEKFMAQGYGRWRQSLMYNQFILVGPPSDPAQVRELEIREAMIRIANLKASFVSRGDGSGTHNKERKLWTKTGIKPQGEWYLEVGQGMGETLTLASEKGAYTLSDRGTFLAFRDKVNLSILVDKGADLLNIYSVIIVSPAYTSPQRSALAQKLADYLISPPARAIISRFGQEQYGEPLFTPMEQR
ncbi:MAG: substrate-binding domain-containing protein [Chloroflexota bacterium]